MLERTRETEPLPFVETTIARLLLARLTVTHEERGITVLSGPWGIGKTTTLDAFAAQNSATCIIVKVDPGSSRRGATPVSVIQHTLEALRPLLGKSHRATLSNAYWSLRHSVYNYLSEWAVQAGIDQRDAEAGFFDGLPPFTLIFDEAQYLSREAIEMLRFWNDSDRGATPFPVGLAFIGNNEFSLQEDRSGDSVISGAVRSRALFVEELDYTLITDADLVLFAQSRGIGDSGAIAALVRHFSQAKVKRDLRNVERIMKVCRLRAGDGPVTLQTVQSVLPPI